ncbi:DNA polymerase epsilon subunit 3 [Eupeodes corollae]|uniref:DNA polymerase epsilon subunit 3 n=1 Tax=Eupeodes corollae TaxID=290404 RepID=UPI00248FCA63|nr:DNA polymerase epsilon subunit 3 [Eupeodes corollae]
MVERIEDLNLPTSVVARLIKEALPDGAIVSKEARAAIARAASVFVIFLTSSSTALAKKQNHKTITANNIFEALEELDFNDFIDPLRDDLETHRKMIKDKKDSKAKLSKDDAAADNEAEAEELADDE